MSPIILAINAGSSSVKVTVYISSPDTSSDPKAIAQCSIDGLTAPPSKLKFQHHDEDSTTEESKDVTSQKDAFEKILSRLQNDHGLSEIKSKDDIKYVCHRVVHGGTYPKAQVIDSETYHHIEQLSDLAPLHNAPALSIISLTTESLPHAINLAFFDTSFHTTLPAPVYTYPLDPEITSKNQLRKYGFHGLSYSSILRSTAQHLSKPTSQTSLIALHLGSGASACAIKNGKSVDTTMGLTPLSGLPGATRSGDVDPSLIFHYTHRAGRPSRSSSKDLHLTYAEEILNKQSGWKAMTGTTDFGVISEKAEEGNEKCKLAFDVLVDRIVGVVGNYFVKLDGEVDALVFAGGIGEKGATLRKAIVQRVACLGWKLDEKKNEAVGAGVVEEIGQDGGKKVLVVKTDETMEMARGSAAFMSEEQ